MQQTKNKTGQDPISSSLLVEEPELFDLVVKFVERLPKQLSDIRSATNDQDWSKLKREVHDLKGLGGNFGFPVISQVAQQIEDKLGYQLYDNIPPLLEELDSISQRITLGDERQQGS